MTVPLPTPTLRIGVTGTRKLDAAQLYFLRPKVESLLRAITEATGAHPRLQLLSPLAEGADRLVADCALAQGYDLICPLPFPQSIYEDDFPTQASRDEFRRLLARAGTNILELDGARDDPKNGLYAESRSYEAVGRLIVRNTDLIIGIWDGRPGEGRGGTADTIHYAANVGPPVIWLHATEGAAEPRWIEDAHDLRHGAVPKEIGAPLKLYLHRLLNPPETHHHAAGWLHGLGEFLDSIEGFVRGKIKRPRPDTPLGRFNAEKPKPKRRLWEFHAAFMRYMARGKDGPNEERARPDNPWARRWFDRYRPATGFSSGYARRYRSGYVLAFMLGAFALAAASISLAASNFTAVKIITTGLELTMLLLIAAIVVTDGRAGWHTRAIDYRLIAELCRKQQTLAPLGWVVPRATAWANTEAEPVTLRNSQHDGPHIEAIPWVAWLFSAWLRETPLPSGTIDAGWVGDAKDSALHDLLDEQIKYHRDRKTQSHRAATRLKNLGEGFFFAVLIVVLIKLVLLFVVDTNNAFSHITLVGLGLLCAILPAASAAFVGIRAYAELEMLADQSAGMLKSLERARAQIKDLDPAAPLASQALGSALAAVALLMLEDLEGWARLFRGKVLDA